MVDESSNSEGIEERISNLLENVKNTFNEHEIDTYKLAFDYTKKKAKEDAAQLFNSVIKDSGIRFYAPIILPDKKPIDGEAGVKYMILDELLNSFEDSEKLELFKGIMKEGELNSEEFDFVNSKFIDYAKEIDIDDAINFNRESLKQDLKKNKRYRKHFIKAVLEKDRTKIYTELSRVGIDPIDNLEELFLEDMKYATSVKTMELMLNDFLKEIENNADRYYEFGKRIIKLEKESLEDFYSDEDRRTYSISLLGTAAEGFKKAIGLDPENISYYDELVETLRDLSALDSGAKLELRYWHKKSTQARIKEIAKPIPDMDKYRIMVEEIEDERKERGAFGKLWRRLTHKKPKFEEITKPYGFERFEEEYDRKSVDDILEGISVMPEVLKRMSSKERWRTLDRYARRHGLTEYLNRIREIKKVLVAEPSEYFEDETGSRVLEIPLIYDSVKENLNNPLEYEVTLPNNLKVMLRGWAQLKKYIEENKAPKYLKQEFDNLTASIKKREQEDLTAMQTFIDTYKDHDTAIKQGISPEDIDKRTDDYKDIRELWSFFDKLTKEEK
ncbi:hypothetical protein KY342_04525 [Candidatus Woesearchaeota archaeon]|nr:hypothetical protein [Candidatus Woesearchaeota archaeon]